MRRFFAEVFLEFRRPLEKISDQGKRRAILGREFIASDKRRSVGSASQM
jgi:hypothetical protein